MATIELIALENFPLVEPGDDLFALLSDSLTSNQLALQDNDILILAQKIISKAENRYVDLNSVPPSEQAIELARQADKDPRQMEVLLAESKEIIKVRPGAVIVEHNNGYVHANAGIDHSNIEQSQEKQQLLLLPKDPDQSALTLHKTIKNKFSVHVPVIINDSFGRPFRNGVCGVCIGAAGLEVIDDKIGERDLFGNILEITQTAIADEISAAASLLMGQSNEGRPVVILRGLELAHSDSDSKALLREKSRDMFRQ